MNRLAVSSAATADFRSPRFFCSQQIDWETIYSTNLSSRLAGAHPPLGQSFFLQQPGAYKRLIAVKRREAAAGSGHLSAAQRRILKIYWPRSGLDTEKRQRAKRASPETFKNGEFAVYQQIRSTEIAFKRPRRCLKASAVNEKKLWW